MRNFVATSLPIIIIAGALLACACPRAQAQNPPDAPPVFSIGAVPAITQRDMSIFEQHICTGAKASGRTFPAYMAWIVALIDAIQVDSGGPTNLHQLGVAADRELADFNAPFPPTKDLERAVAQDRGTHLQALGEDLIRQFRGQPQPVRRAAADYLKKTYALPVS